MPKWIEIVRSRLGVVDLESERAREIVEELATQLEDVYQDARRRGLDDAEAVGAALREVPDWDEFRRSITAAVREGASRPSVRLRDGLGGGLGRDFRHAVRLLLRRPGFSALAILALALGIGANAVAFTFVTSMLFPEMPVHEPDRLIRVYGRIPDGLQHATISYPDYLDIAERVPFLDGILAEKLVPLNLGTERGNERVWGYAVSGNYFTLLGVEPVLGQLFDHEGHEPGQHPVVVLSYGFWQRAFGGDRGVIGQKVVLNGYPFTVAAVTPAGFTGTNVGLSPSVWAPVSMSEYVLAGFEILYRRNRSFLSVARLAPGVSVDEARVGLDVIAEQLAAEYPDENQGYGLNVLPESEGGIHPMMRGGFIGFSGVLATVVALVLLLACANVAGLLLSRSFQRRREVGLRLALGASRGRLVRQFLVESAVLAVLSGALGFALAFYGLRLLAAIQIPTDVPFVLPLTIDARVLAFTLVVTIATTLLVGLVPAFQGARTALVPALKDGAGLAHRRTRLRNALVASQIALSAVLLVGTGLFLRSLANAQSIDLGFDPRNTVMSSIDLGLQGYSPERGQVFFEELGERIKSLSGVESVGWANMLPFDFNINQNEIVPEGYEPPDGGGYPSVNRNVVSAGYFATMRTRLVAGRDFDARDHVDGPPVAIVNETLAEQFWPGETAVGKRLGRPGISSFEVVGVVQDGKYLTLGEDPKPFVFYPSSQRRNLDMTFVVRTRGEPAALLPEVRDVARAMDPDLPVYNVKLLEDHVQIALAPARAGAAILGSFGALALVLAAIGLYGVVAFWVSQRTHEIGIRRALGAEPSDIFKNVLRNGMLLVLPGLAVGVAASVVGARFAVSVLYGIDPLDPVAFGAALFVLAVTALVACLAPARRAVAVDPVVALRYE